MPYPLISLDTPTQLFLQWGWLLSTVANAIVAIGIVLVFLLGATVRLPGVKRELRRAETEGVPDANAFPGPGTRS